MDLEFKRMFVRYISHEIRTPLNTVVLGLQLIQSELATLAAPADLKDAVVDSRTSCDNAVQVLNEFLTFDKLEGGTLVLEVEEINAWPLIQQTIHPFHVVQVCTL